MDMNVVYTIVISCALSSSDKMEINNHNEEEKKKEKKTS